MPLADVGQVLVVDDDPSILKMYAAVLKMAGLRNVITESDSRLVMERMNNDVEVVILDLHMPYLTGFDLLPLLSEHFPHVPLIVATSMNDVSVAVSCIKMGAFDYVTKPIENERLISILHKALDWRTITAQARDLASHLMHDRLDYPEAFAGIVTRSRKMRALCQYVEVAARTQQPVMIIGESGTGKELIARAIHRLSGCSGSLVSINAAGLDDAVFSDTLFGHKRGAFTGADQARDGLVAKAAGGLLFLDEIGDLGPGSQVRLLRLIQEREYFPVGSDTPRRCDARVVCASNRDLKKLVSDGIFRNDLYYRLNVHLVSLPPLRERKEDIPLLLEHFIDQSAQELHIKPPSYPRELLELLAGYHFPGNIRELQAMVLDALARRQTSMLSMESFRNVILSQSSRALPSPSNSPDEEWRLKMLESIWGHFPTLAETEELLIASALKAAGGNQGIAATMLGLKRQTLNMRLRKNRT